MVKIDEICNKIIGCEDKSAEPEPEPEPEVNNGDFMGELKAFCKRQFARFAVWLAEKA